MKATCQSCQGYAPDKCAKGYPFWGSAHICVKGFEPREFLRNGKLNGITIDHLTARHLKHFVLSKSGCADE